MADNEKEFKVRITGEDDSAGAFASAESAFKKLGLTAEQVEAEIRHLGNINEEDAMAQHFRTAEVELRRLGLTSQAVQKEMESLRKIAPMEVEHLGLYDRIAGRLDRFGRHEAPEGGEHEAIGHGWEGISAHVNILKSHFGELRENVGETRESLAEMFPMLAGFGALASAAGLVELIHSTAEEQAQLQAMSKQLGVTANDLEAFHYAANMSDVPIDTMDKSMGKLGITMEAAVAGHDKLAAQMFAKMGISLKDAKGHLEPMTTILPEVAQALKNTADPAMRLYVATTLFGKSGRDMLPLLIQGSEHIKDLTNEAEKLGPALTDLDRDHLEQFNDAWKQAQYVSESFMTKLGADLAPVMTPLLDDFTQFVAVNKDWIAEDVAGAVKNTADAIKQFPWKDAIAGAKGFASDIGDVAKDLNGLVQHIPGGWTRVIEGFAIYKAASPFAHMIGDGMRLAKIAGLMTVKVGKELPAALALADNAWTAFSASGVAAFNAIKDAEIASDGAFRQTLLGKTMALSFAVAEAGDAKVNLSPQQQSLLNSFHLQPGEQLTPAERAQLNSVGPSIDVPTGTSRENFLSQEYDRIRRQLFGPSSESSPVVPLPGSDQRGPYGRYAPGSAGGDGQSSMLGGRDSTVHVQIDFPNAPPGTSVTTTTTGPVTAGANVGQNMLGATW